MNDPLSQLTSFANNSNPPSPPHQNVFHFYGLVVYSSSSILRAQRRTQKPVKHAWRNVFYRTLCNAGILRTRGIFRTLSNIYDGKIYSQPCVTLVYLEPWHIQNPRHIQNTAKHQSRNILFKTLCNPDTFRTQNYILKSKHIQNPAIYLR